MTIPCSSTGVAMIFAPAASKVLRGVLCSQERRDRLAIKVCCGIAGGGKLKAVLVVVHHVGADLLI